VRYVEALFGFQLFGVMVSVSGMLPVFLMYIVCVAVLPGFIFEKVMVVMVCLQVLSEYMPKFTVVTVFLEELFDWF
jgi:hypothetical protein